MTTDPSKPQPAPVQKSEHPDVLDMVIRDLEERARDGERKYGTRLKGFNGRLALVDAYQEALDLAMYLRQQIYEDANR